MNWKKRICLILALVLIFSAAVQGVAAPMLTGVSPRVHWASDSVLKLSMQGYSGLEGLGDNLDQVVTREQFCSWLHKAAGINIQYFAAPDVSKIFKDVSNDRPSATIIYDLVTVGIVDDMDFFRPSSPITREEAAHYLSSAYFYKMGQEKPTQAVKSKVVSDLSSASPVFEKDILFAFSMGLARGRGNGIFFPKSLCTLAESSVMIERFLTLIALEVRVDAETTDKGLVLKLRLTNTSNDKTSLTFDTSQEYDFVLYDSNGDPLYRWSAHQIFAQVLTILDLAPGTTEEFSLLITSDMVDLQKCARVTAFVPAQLKSLYVNPQGFSVPLNNKNPGEKMPDIHGVSEPQMKDQN